MMGVKSCRNGLLCLAFLGKAEAFKCLHEGLILPLFGQGEMDLPNPFRLFLYLLGLFWIFLGVAVISDVFMAGIEKITSAKRRTKTKSGRVVTVYVWNATVANLTLMALGSSAPEILLSLIEITCGEFFQGPLGAGTIVGSAAFNLLIISAVCVLAIPDGEVRFIKQVPVYAITASCSVFAYIWLMFILMVTSPDVCEVWEGVVTLLMCPLLVFVAYLADRGYFGGEKKEESEEETIPNDVTDEELAAIAKAIREQHGENLTQEQVVKIMRVQYFNKRSRAFYRHAAMEAKLHGKKVDMTAQPPPEFAIQEAISTSDDVKSEKRKKRCQIGHACEKYAFAEACGTAKLTLFRGGNKDSKATVKYSTKDGTAKAPSDYEAVDGALATFEKGSDRTDIFITIKDDTAFEGDENFFIILSDPVCTDGAAFEAVLAEGHVEAEITIIDDDLPGELRFKTEEVEHQEEEEDSVVRVVVTRFNGSTGKIGCNYHTDSMGAVDGIDFEGSKGYLEFDQSILTATIPITIKPKGRINQTAFNVVLEEPQGTKFDIKTDGGEEQCICHVVIKGCPVKATEAGMFAAMKDRVHSANAVQGHNNWGQQFKDAIFSIGEGDDEEEEEGGEPKEASGGPSKFDWFMHIVSVPWKLLFAFVPPVDYCGGWACFCGALVMIAFVTAIVGDMANLVGCTLDILPETAAITFVALGTSLPDTFASKTAAMMDPYADASIGNVTGSNSVNVFLGIGIAWTLAAFYWEMGGKTDVWTTKLLQNKPEVIKKVIDVAGADGAVFVTPAGSIWFNLMVFSLNAFLALQHLFARRKKWGGELGGPKKGFMGQYFSAGFLLFQWFIYIVASIVFARLGEPVTYTDIAILGATADITTPSPSALAAAIAAAATNTTR
jgi:solute carrier family 8 (sodium/calcium exchanger)